MVTVDVQKLTHSQIMIILFKITWHLSYQLYNVGCCIIIDLIDIGESLKLQDAHFPRKISSRKRCNLLWTAKSSKVGCNVVQLWRVVQWDSDGCQA